MSEVTPSPAKNGYIIAIDGPVASGKGTISPKLAQAINGFYLYSGSVFRCIGLLCLEKGIDTHDEHTVSSQLEAVTIALTESTIIMNGKDVTDRVRQEDVAMASSNVGQFKKVREIMVQVMRDIARQKNEQGIPVVTEGRDMATTVFPHARVKLYLTADPAVRAKRRLSQIQARGDVHVQYEDVLADTKTRDQQDYDRVLSPLVKDPEKYGYIVIDSSDMNESDTIEKMLTILKEQGLTL